MKLEDMIEELKATGYTIRINHERATPESVEEALQIRAEGHRQVFPVTYPVYVLKQMGEQVDSRGGKTTARLYLGGSLVGEGEAICSPLDQFRRYEGAIRALGRATSQARRTNPVVH